MYPMNNYNYYPPQNGSNQTPPQQLQYQRQPVSMPMTMGLKGHPVSSLEEVRAVSIDFDGSVFYFPDLANRRIYTKQINLDGTPLYRMYELTEIPQNQGTASYITREEFEETIKTLQNNFVSYLGNSSPSQKGELKNF